MAKQQGRNMDTDKEAICIGVDGHGDVIGADADTYTYDFGSMDSNLSWPTINITGTSGQIYANLSPSSNLTIDDTIWSNGWTSPSGHLKLTGDDADIDVNGVSLMATLKNIQTQLNMLCPAPEMEAEWDQLREIREQYEAKLAECREKSRAWKALQQRG
jgi:hypothetical protein